MARKRYKPEEIVAKLRQVDVLVSQGQNMVDAIRQIGLRTRLLPRSRVCGRGAVSPPIIEGNLRPEINSMLWRAWSEASESSSGSLKMQQKLFRR
jgi:hypothetical protein